MRAVLVTLALLLTAVGCPQEPTQTSSVRCQEDQPCWDCKTMGNKKCGPGETRAA